MSTIENVPEIFPDKEQSEPENRTSVYFTAADLGLILSGLMWGGNNVITKALYTQMNPGVFMVLRFILASLVLLPLVRILDGGIKIRPEDWKPMLVLSLIGIGILQPIYLFGLSYTTAANTALIFATAPAIVALLSHFIDHKGLNRYGWGGIAVAFFGIALLVQGGNGFNIHSQSFWGNALCLLGAVLWALYTYLSAPLMERYSPLRVTGLSISIGTIPLLFAGIPGMLSQNWSRIDFFGWGGVVYSAVFSVVFAYLLWNLGVKKIGSSRATIYQNISPLTTVILSMIFLGDKFTPLMIAGVLVCLAGLYMVRILGKSR